MERGMAKVAFKLDFSPHGEAVPQTILKGIPAVYGKAEGPAAVITGHNDLEKIKAGAILVCQSIWPDLTPIFPLIKAIVADQGGMLADAAIIAREQEIPTVVGVRTATESIHDGDIISVDGTLGNVKIIKKG